MSPEQVRGLALCTLVSCTIVVMFTTGKMMINPMSRLATMDALVHDRTFAIDHSEFRNTVDKVKIGDHFYSSKPPLLSVIGAGIYGSLHATTGLSFRADREQAVRVMSLILGGVPHLLLLVYAARFIMVFAAPAVALWVFACFAFGQIGLGYSTMVNNHVPAALAAFVSFYYAYLIRRHGSPEPHGLIFAGFAAGLAPTFDLAALFVSAGVGLYLLSFDWKRTLQWFCPSALVPIVLHFILTYQITGGIMPISTRPDLYQYSGSYWNAPTGVDALDEPRATYLFNILLGHHGLFSMTPVMIVAVIAIALALVRSGKPHRAEALVAAGALFAMIAFYTATTTNYGGVCVGFRWFLPITPVVMLFTADWLASVRTKLGWGLFAALLAVSQFHAFNGLGNPWQRSRWESWLSESFDSADRQRVSLTRHSRTAESPSRASPRTRPPHPNLPQP